MSFPGLGRQRSISRELHHGQGLTGVLCQERQVQISSVSVCVCTVPDLRVCSRVAEVYGFMVALVNRIVQANGNCAVVMF